MNRAIELRYAQARHAGFHAQAALRDAKIREAFEWGEYHETVRLIARSQEFGVSEDDLFGDTYNEDLNAATVPGGVRTIRAEHKAAVDRVERDGVWGIVGEYKCPTCGAWTHADSVWGFVGDDWQFSGYDVDVMAETLERAKHGCEKGC